MESKKSGGFAETIRTVVYAVIIALVVRTFAFEPFNIPSSSMEPTLLVGDYLFVSKYSYGYSRYSLPWGLPAFEGRILNSEPERGDVVVFKLPRDNETDYIKRLIGLPGDRIQVIRGILHINGEAVKREEPSRAADADDAQVARWVKEFVETLPNGRQHLIQEMSDSASHDNTREFVVPAEHFFFMGDNRDRSLDSRATDAVGFVPVANLVGRAEFLFFSHNGTGRFWEIWRWPQMIRFGRIFQGVE
jgi:signal peptidase I